MASSIAYSTLLGLAQPVNGQEAGTWGDDINLGLTNYLDSAIAGTLTISSSSDATLSISNYSTANPNLGSTSSQYMILSCTANLSAVQHINVPQTSKMYLVFNGTTGSSNNINVRGYTGSTYTTGVTLVPGERALVAYSLSANDVIKVSSNFLTGLTGTFTSGGVVYANTTSTLTTSGALTQYGVLYGGGAGGAPLATAAGTNNQLLVATTSAAPSWINPSSVTVGAATTATTAGTCTGNAATATNPDSGGSFITSNNIGSQSVSYASSAGSASTATTATTATTANALNTSNAYTGTTFTATTQFSGPGTGLTGTASSLTVGTATTATTASTANALNTSNTYGINGLYIYNGNGINFYASGNVNYITVAAASANSLYVGGGLQATGLLQGTQLADSLFRVTSGSSANAGSFGTIFIDFAPSGTFTLTFPDNPLNGQKFSVGTYSNTITFAASPGAGTSYIGGVPSTITPTTPAQWTYYSGTSAWFRSG